MAAPRPNREISRASTKGLTYPSRLGPPMPHGEQNGGAKHHLSRVEALVVQLYGQGVARRKVAALMLKFLAPPDGEADRSKRMRTAIKRLKQMEERKWFRDALWDHSMIQADLQTPQIIQGVVRKAKRGRVDAAKLALGLVGRYEEGPGVQQATQVNVVFGAEVPRPSNRSMERQGEADVVEDADWDEVD